MHEFFSCVPIERGVLAYYDTPARLTSRSVKCVRPASASRLELSNPLENHMQFAHIYRIKGGKFQLLATNGASIIDAVLIGEYPTLREAKAAAAARGLQPGNY